MSRHFYRFRPARAVLKGFNELEHQEIYFSRPQDLNDPLEGFKDLFWRGDEIVWMNLFKHYVLCLMQSVMLALTEGPDHEFDNEQNFVLSNEDTLPSADHKNDYRRMCQLFFQHEDVAALPKLLSARASPVRRNELSTYLRTIHMHALNAVLTSFEDSGQIPHRPPQDPIRAAGARRIPLKEMIEGLNRSELEHRERADFADVFSAATNAAWMQTTLINDYNGTSFTQGRAWRTLVSDLPSRHPFHLERLLYRDWYVACFVADPSQAAMWGHYADSHKGVCLKFRTQPNSAGQPSILLKGINVEAHDANADVGVPMTLHQVKYAGKSPEVDFFRSLGAITGPMLRYWFADASGKRSELFEHTVGRTDESRQRYWETSTALITTKLEDWRHEAEYRIVVRPLSDLSSPEKRKFRYSFECLEGIIFGIQTSATDKLDIIRIIEKKCRAAGRKDFEFHQAYYSSSLGRIATQPLRLINFA